MASEHISETEILKALDGELPADQAEIVREHTGRCDACRSKWVRFANLSGQIAEMERAESSYVARRAALAALLAGIAKAQRGLRIRRMVMRTVSVAAAAILVAAVMLRPGPRPVAPANATGQRVSTSQTLPDGYLSLPFADPGLPLDEASVLPVEVSREDLRLIGVQVDEGVERVQAEIVLGMDGWPRAIRIME